VSLSVDTVRSRDGVALHRRIWLCKEYPRALLLIIHGYGEHGGRYDDAAGYLAGQGIACVAVDLRNHGASEGERGALRSAGALLKDVDAMIARLPEDLARLPRFFWGHSMGGLLLSLYFAARDFEAKGLIFTGAALAPGASATPLKVGLVKLLGGLLPGLGTEAVDPSFISRIPAEVRAYAEDPANFHGKMDAGTALVFLNAFDQVRDCLGQINAPSLMMHGGADKLTNPEGTQLLYDTCSSQDKTLHIFPDAFHELHHDLVREEMLGKMIDWIGERL